MLMWTMPIGSSNSCKYVKFLQLLSLDSNYSNRLNAQFKHSLPYKHHKCISLAAKASVHQEYLPMPCKLQIFSRHHRAHKLGLWESIGASFISRVIRRESCLIEIVIFFLPALIVEWPNHDFKGTHAQRFTVCCKSYNKRDKPWFQKLMQILSKLNCQQQFKKWCRRQITILLEYNLINVLTNFEENDENVLNLKITFWLEMDLLSNIW